MAPTFPIRFLQAFGALALVTAATGICGDVEPSHIRTATIGGVRGPVYYSVVDRSYRPVGHSSGTASPQQMAEILPPLP
ncbi:hypothetical protein [Aureimonas glaciei]|jgi:hypothetical protein|uniref:Uncharacterized protein n=1 Tax=Aureimonas glaciei TaxID=1776957 RepID=A0A916YAB5_9HYPH|nr:hypothetical protein [Aureimonas glaciei]GGD36536.1 hypothetical protein GCM10011335_44400 [Aureimonas glaciei]